MVLATFTTPDWFFPDASKSRRDSATCRLTTRCSGRVTIKCTRPTGVLESGAAAMRRRRGAPPLNGTVRRH